MIELRWVVFGPNKQLEYRLLPENVCVNGYPTPDKEKGPWIVVPTVTGDEAAYEDLRNSGGICFDDRPNRY